MIKKILTCLLVFVFVLNIGIVGEKQFGILNLDHCFASEENLVLSRTGWTATSNKGWNVENKIDDYNS